MNYSYIVLTETWLNSNLYTNELGLINYNVFKFGKSPLTGIHERDVVIVVRKDIPSFLINVVDNFIEQFYDR